MRLGVRLGARANLDGKSKFDGKKGVIFDSFSSAEHGFSVQMREMAHQRSSLVTSVPAATLRRRKAAPCGVKGGTVGGERPRVSQKPREGRVVQCERSRGSKKSRGSKNSRVSQKRRLNQKSRESDEAWLAVVAY
jgi:hypothetical protein